MIELVNENSISSKTISSKIPPKKLTVIQPVKGWFGINLVEVWNYRELFFILAIREVQLRYRQTFLGITWVILQPLITTTIFTIIFGTLINVDSENTTYELFAFTGLLPWTLFSQSLQRSGVSLIRNIQMITRVFFPRIIIPISNSVSTLVDFAISFLLLIILLLIFGISIPSTIFFVPIIIFFNMLLASGMGIWFAALNVYYRDFTYILPFVIQLWMFASPLAYSSSVIPPAWSWVYVLNPMVGIIDAFRWAVLGSIEFPLIAFVYSVLMGLTIFSGGLIIFRKLERGFADVI